ncbi:alkaline phosphatase D family protein [Membranihabitans marinus]|uniref:alkaline phosphatase D family protein n=1 Tax=Membranihabitans marinus TaxID=1227546 RepID=UPI001F3F4053|nr:alkaline phosphatase D family protein [Membranihabitans marinus]
MKNKTFKDRRHFIEKMGVGFLSVSLWDMEGSARLWKSITSKKSPVYFTNGFKISELTSNSVVIWTRLCGQEKPNPVRHERREEVFRHPIDFDESQPVDQMDGAVKGQEGLARVKITSSDGEWVSDWMTANEGNDYTIKVPCDGLKPLKEYQLEIEAKASKRGPVNSISTTFKTPPTAADIVPVNMVTSTCQYFWSFDDDERGFQTYDTMRKLKPDFFVQTGDYIYYDKPGPLAKNIEQARHKWHAMDGWLSLRDFYKEVPIYMIKDDHDLLKDDAYKGKGNYGDLSIEDGIKIWYENAPIVKKPYRSIRWGKDLEIWMVEGREYRSRNDMEDGPDKSIWGEEQKKWFVETVEASDATFKILISATPVVGPDRERKSDNHANAVFKHEGTWLRKFIANQKNMYVVNGDRHWQYVSQDLETKVMEFGSGPISDYHVQGWNAEDYRPEHRYLNLKGGFLGIEVFRKEGRPYIQFRHYSAEGQVHHLEEFSV